MLVFFTSNNEVNDKHLDDRFYKIEFPSNRREALKRYALELCAADREYQQADTLVQNKIRNRINKDIEAGKTIEGKPLDTFRKVDLYRTPLCFDMVHYDEDFKTINHAKRRLS